MRSIFSALFLLAATLTTASAKNVFTPTRGPSCIGISAPEYNIWRCPGPAGYVAEFSDEGNVVSVGIARRPSLRSRAVHSTVNFRGAGNVFGDKLQWLMEGAQPIAAVLRVWRIDDKDERGESEVQELLVFKVEPAKSCQVAVVNARTPSANEIAVVRALEAASFPCGDK